MRRISLFLVLVLVSCNEGGDANVETPRHTLNRDDYSERKTGQDTNASAPLPTPAIRDTIVRQKTPERSYANQRFKEVRVQQVDPGRYRINGKAQVFEANFSWVVEDGHNQLLKGHQTTDAGAPEWGKFDFTIQVDKKRTNSTLTLILFEASAKDGSPQYELPITLD